jgi:hypothetical protein
VPVFENERLVVLDLCGDTLVFNFGEALKSIEVLRAITVE